MTGDLAAFTAARLAEDEARTRSLLSAAQWAVQELTEHQSHYLGRSVPGWHDWPDVVAMCSRALREIEADRKLLAEYELYKDAQYPDYEGGYASALEAVLKLRAAVWSTHPDYREGEFSCLPSRSGLTMDS